MALSAPLLTRKRCVQVKVEAEKGTQLLTTPTDGLFFDPTMSPTAPFIERKGAGLYLGHTQAGILGELSGEWSAEMEYRTNGTIMDPALAIILQGCGFKKSTESYAPTSTHSEQSTLTIIQSEDGIRKIMHGCMGNVSIEGEIGKRIMVKPTMSGIWDAPTDQALPAYTPGTTAPLMMKGGTFTITPSGGSALSVLISKFSLDMGNTVAMRPDPDTASGIGYYIITDRDPIFTMDPEADLVAGIDFYGAWLAGTEAAVSLAFGSNAYEITITIPKFQYREIKDGDRDGVQIYDVTGQCNITDGNDEVTIAV